MHRGWGYGEESVASFGEIRKDAPTPLHTEVGVKLFKIEARRWTSKFHGIRGIMNTSSNNKMTYPSARTGESVKVRVHDVIHNRDSAGVRASQLIPELFSFWISVPNILLCSSPQLLPSKWVIIKPNPHPRILVQNRN